MENNQEIAKAVPVQTLDMQDATKRQKVLEGMAHDIIRMLYLKQTPDVVRALNTTKNSVVGLVIPITGAVMSTVIKSFFIESAKNPKKAESQAMIDTIHTINSLASGFTYVCITLSLFMFAMAAYWFVVGVKLTNQQRTDNLNQLRDTVAGVTPAATRNDTLSFLNSLISIRNTLPIGSPADKKLRSTLENSLLPLLLAGNVVLEIEAYQVSRTPEQKEMPEQQELLTKLSGHELVLKNSVRQAAIEMGEFSKTAKELVQGDNWGELKTKTNQLLSNVQAKAEEAHSLLPGNK